ncbi:unnamed protein product [Porites lobata]|uniref:Uncharacterized protein n=1 Tax=Porites lobata TaxID=104759 RepID=A0ABN8N058_9CNID|nr:unnamed protein product [Porites lobata]
MEVQAEIHSLPSERKSLLQSTSHSTIPYDRIVNSMRQARKNRDLLKLAEQIEVLDDQGALRPEIRKGRSVLPSALRNLFNRLTSLFKKNSRVNSHRHLRRRKNYM